MKLDKATWGRWAAQIAKVKVDLQLQPGAPKKHDLAIT